MEQRPLPGGEAHAGHRAASPQPDGQPAAAGRRREQVRLGHVPHPARMRGPGRRPTGPAGAPGRRSRTRRPAGGRCRGRSPVAHEPVLAPAGRRDRWRCGGRRTTARRSPSAAATARHAARSEPNASSPQPVARSGGRTSGSRSPAGRAAADRGDDVAAVVRRCGSSSVEHGSMSNQSPVQPRVRRAARSRGAPGRPPARSDRGAGGRRSPTSPRSRSGRTRRGSAR